MFISPLPYTLGGTAMQKVSIQLSKLSPRMARYATALSFGSDAIARKRQHLYKEGAKKLENGNFSRMIMRIVDKALGIDLPLPVQGRPRKNKKL